MTSTATATARRRAHRQQRPVPLAFFASVAEQGFCECQDFALCCVPFLKAKAHRRTPACATCVRRCCGWALEGGGAWSLRWRGDVRGRGWLAFVGRGKAVEVVGKL